MTPVMKLADFEKSGQDMEKLVRDRSLRIKKRPAKKLVTHDAATEDCREGA